LVQKTTIYTHAKTFHEIAKSSYEKSDEKEGAVIIAIMMSVISIETFLNETIYASRHQFHNEQQKSITNFSEIMTELEERRESTLMKFRFGLILLNRSAVNENSEIAQDLKILISLRNALVHMKSDNWSVKIVRGQPDPERSLKDYPKFIRQMIDKKLIEKPKRSTTWTELIETKEIAKWACETARLTTVRFYNGFPKGNFKVRLKETIFE